MSEPKNHVCEIVFTRVFGQEGPQPANVESDRALVSGQARIRGKDNAKMNPRLYRPFLKDSGEIAGIVRHEGSPFV